MFIFETKAGKFLFYSLNIAQCKPVAWIYQKDTLITKAAEYPCAAARPQYSKALTSASSVVNIGTSPLSNKKAALLCATS